MLSLNIDPGAGRARYAKEAPRATGFFLAAAIIGSWLAVHLGCIFGWRWSPLAALLAVPVVLLQAWLSTGLFIVAHDCIHGSLVPGFPLLNRVVGTISLGLYAGLSYRRLEVKHWQHHRHPGTADDPDYNAANPQDLSPWLMRFFLTYYTHSQLLRITVLAVVYILLNASLLNIIVFWAIPALAALFQLFYFGTYLPHRDDGTAFADQHRARSQNFSRLQSLATCFNFGAYHHEHHCDPKVPWWRLPRVRYTAAQRSAA